MTDKLVYISPEMEIIRFNLCDGIYTDVVITSEFGPVEDMETQMMTESKLMDS